MTVKLRLQMCSQEVLGIKTLATLPLQSEDASSFIRSNKQIKVHLALSTSWSKILNCKNKTSFKIQKTWSIVLNIVLISLRVI